MLTRPPSSPIIAYLNPAPSFDEKQHDTTTQDPSRQSFTAEEEIAEYWLDQEENSRSLGTERKRMA
jgi:hypothetical protein